MLAQHILINGQAVGACRCSELAHVGVLTRAAKLFGGYGYRAYGQYCGTCQNKDSSCQFFHNRSPLVELSCFLKISRRSSSARLPYGSSATVVLHGAAARVVKILELSGKTADILLIPGNDADLISPTDTPLSLTLSVNGIIQPQA